MRILLVEDEEEIAKFIVSGLRAERFAVDWATTGEKGFMLGKINPYDCAIFDIRLSGDPDGMAVCRSLREKGKAFPVIMLSVTRDAEIKIAALNSGADDYMTKPFLFAELLARIRALLRREKTIIGPKLVLGDLSMDTTRHTVFRGSRAISLNRKEFALLEYFMRNKGIVLTRGMILDHVWDVNADQFTNTVDVHVRFLRRKIDDGRRKKLIHTVHGEGYKIEG
jgi:DNA-binding response OmpR family regulator